MQSVFILLLLALSLPGAADVAAPGNGEDATELIAAFREVPRSRVGERISLLERIHACGTEEAVRFVANLADSAAADSLRARAFALWASTHASETIAEFLVARRSSPKFGVYIPVIPEIVHLERFEVLSGFYADAALAQHEKALFEALAALDDELSFEFLAERWSAIDDASAAYDRLVALFAMKGSWAVSFLDGLLMSPHPYGRCVAAERMLTIDPVLSIARIGVFLQVESDPRVRTRVIAALGALAMPEAAGLLVQTADWHSSRRLHEIVDALLSMPVETVRDALPEDWHADRETRRFRVAALSLLRPRDPDSPRRSPSSADRELIRRVKPAAKSRSFATRIVAAVAIGRISNNENTIQRLMTKGDADDRWEVLDTLESFRIGDPFVVKKLGSVAQSRKSWELRIKAAKVFGVLGSTEGIDPLAKCLGDSQLLVRIAAIKALARIRDGRSVDLLVDRLPKETGRAAWEIARSLKILTGRAFGIESAKWSDWRKQQGGEPVAAEKAVEGKAAWVDEESRSGRYSFYGLEIDSHNIAFAIDVSGSMAGPYAGSSEKEAPISRLRRELTRTIKSLTPGHAINMIFFETQVRRWRNGLVPMEADRGGYREEALTYARYLRAEGGTNLYGALMTAMADPEVDAVVLLSDGDPTAGRIQDKGGILNAVLRRNRVLQATVHVIALGKADASFLKRLARGTGGTFKKL